MKIRQVLIGIVALVLGAFVLSGCSMPSTAGDEIAVHFGGGPIEAKTPKGCVAPGTRERNSGGDHYYYYPANQRTYDFTGKKDSDAGAITVVSKDNQTLTIPGTINFDLNTDCKVLTAFHINIGARYGAYMADGEDGNKVTGKGWTKVLNLYIGRAADATLDRVAKQYNWKELYSDPSIKDEMNAQVNETIARLVQQQTDGDQEFFQHFSALIQQPQADPDLVKSLKDKEVSISAAAAVEAKAKADASAAEAAANAQVAQKKAEALVAAEEAKIQAATIAPFGSARAYNDYLAIQKGLNPYQPSYGSGPLVTAPSK